MARPLRIEYAGALYYVTSRGDRRENIYHEDDDRELWLEIFENRGKIEGSASLISNLFCANAGVLA